MYFEDQRKQGRNRSFAQVENISSKQKSQNQLQMQSQNTKYLQQPLIQTSDRYNPAQTSQQNKPTSITTQTIQIQSKGAVNNQYSTQLPMSYSSDINRVQGILNQKISKQQNFKHSDHQGLQLSQQVQGSLQVSSSIQTNSKSKPSTISSVLQEQNLNIQKIKSSQNQNVGQNHTTQIKNIQKTEQNIQIQNTGSYTESNPNLNNLLTNQNKFENQVSAKNNEGQIESEKHLVNKRKQFHHKTRQKTGDDPIESQMIQSHQNYNICQPTTFTNYPFSKQNESSSQQLQQQTSPKQRQQSQNIITQHQRHFSEVSIQNQLNQLNLVGNKQQASQQTTNTNFVFSKDPSNKENYVSSEMKLGVNNQQTNSYKVDQNTHSNINKASIPNTTDVQSNIVAKKQISKATIEQNQMTNNYNQSYSTQYYGNSTSKNDIKNTIRSGYNNKTNQNGTTASQKQSSLLNSQKLDMISKENNVQLKQKHSRQNSLCILPTHFQFNKNELHTVINEDNTYNKNMQGNTSNNNGNNSDQKNNEKMIHQANQENVERYQIKNSNKKPILNISDELVYGQTKQQNINKNEILNQEEQNNSFKSINYKQLSIHNQDIKQGYNTLNNRRISTALIETQLNCINLIDNLSNQNTNRSISGYSNNMEKNPNKNHYDNSNQSSMHKNNQIQSNINQITISNSKLNNQYQQIYSNQSSNLPTPSSTSYRSNQFSNNIDNNAKFQFHPNQNQKISPKQDDILINELNNKYTYFSQQSQFISQNQQPYNQTEKEQSFIKDCPQSQIEKHRKYHSISNNLLDLHEENLKQSIMNSKISDLANQQMNLQVTSHQPFHQQSTNSILGLNISNNNSQMISSGTLSHNQSNQQTNSKSPLNIRTINTNRSINTVQCNFSNLKVSNNSNNQSNISNNLNKSNISNSSNSNISQNYINNSQNTHKQTIILKNINNQQNLSTNITADQKSVSNNDTLIITDAQKSNELYGSNIQTNKTFNLTFAEQLKLQKQKNTLEQINTGISIDGNNSINNVNNEKEMNTQVYSQKSQNTSSYQSSQNKQSKDVGSSSIKTNEIQTNPNSERSKHLVENSLLNQLPQVTEFQAIQNILKQNKYIPSSDNEQKYFTLQYQKGYKFDPDTSNPARKNEQIIQNNYKALPIVQNTEQLKQYNNQQNQNINQLKNTTKPSLIDSELTEIYQNISQSTSNKREMNHSDLISKTEKYQINTQSYNLLAVENYGINQISSNKISEQSDDSRYGSLKNIQNQINSNIILNSQSYLKQNVETNIQQISNNYNYSSSNQYENRIVINDNINKTDNYISDILVQPSYIKQETSNIHTDTHQLLNVQIIDKNNKQQMLITQTISQEQLNQPVKWYLNDYQEQFQGLENKEIYKKQQQNSKIIGERIEKTGQNKNIQNNLILNPSTIESITIQQNLYSSEPTSLTQISTYREENSKFIQNLQHTNDNNIDEHITYNNNFSKDYNTIQYQKQQNTKQNEAQYNQIKSKQPQQFNQTNKNEIPDNNSPSQILKPYNYDIKDSYLTGFEDIANYFNNNNGNKPSNNTPEKIQNKKKFEQKYQFDSNIFNDLYQSVQSLQIKSITQNPLITDDDQAEKDDENMKNINLKKISELNSNSPNIQAKYFEDLDIIQSCDNLQRFKETKKQQVNQFDEVKNLNNQNNQHEFSSYSNLYQKNNQKNNLKSNNDWEELYQINEEYCGIGYNKIHKNNSNSILNDIDEDLKMETDLNQAIILQTKQGQNDYFMNNINKLNENKINFVDNNEELFDVDEMQSNNSKEYSNNLSIDDDQLLCDEDDLQQELQSNISNIIKEIDNEDPNQAFFQCNKYDQGHFNLQSFSNYKHDNLKLHSNTTSLKKTELHGHELYHESQTSVIAPFNDGTPQNLSQYNKKYEKQSNNIGSLDSKPLKKSKNDERKGKENQLKGNEILILESQYEDNSILLQNQNEKNKKSLPNKRNKLEELNQLKQDLENFESNQSQFPIFGGEHLNYLLTIEEDYAPNPYYMKKQQSFTPLMRAILIDWMMEVCEEFGLKRETYYIALNMIDRMFSIKSNLSVKEFQLIGVTSLHMASKLEEVIPPKMEEFIASTDNGYTAEMINEQEKDLLMHLKFKINPPTVSFWGNWFMSQWDIFIQTSEKAQNSLLVLNYYNENSNFIQFKQPHSKSYDLFREYMSIIDFTYLNLETLQIKYTVLHWKAFGVFDEKIIYTDIADGMIYSKKFDEYNNLFNEFSGVSFGMSIDGIVNVIQYATSFFSLPFTNNMPFVVSQNKQHLQGNYEEFLQYQTHNKDQIKIFKELLN